MLRHALAALALLIGCGSPPSTTPAEPSSHTTAEAGRVGADSDSDSDAAPDAVDELEATDAGAACAPAPAAGPLSDSCFRFDSCEACGIDGSGSLYWCSGDAGRPSIQGCVEGTAMSGCSGACCPSTSRTCTRLAPDDAYCASQQLPGSAYACPVDPVTDNAAVMPTATACLPSGTTFDALGNPVLPSDRRAGAALSPAQMDALYCCQGE
jgi:hypothetical protein